MNRILDMLFMIIAMICILIEECSCYQILVVGLLFLLLFSNNDFPDLKV